MGSGEGRAARRITQAALEPDPERRQEELAGELQAVLEEDPELRAEAERVVNMASSFTAGDRDPSDRD